MTAGNSISLSKCRALVLLLIIFFSAASKAQKNSSNSSRTEASKREVATLHEQADDYLKEGDFDKALRFANAAVANSPSEAKHYLLRSKVYEALGNLNAALTDLSIAVELNPADAATRFDRAWLAYREGRTDLARADFRILLNKGNTVTSSVYYRQNYGRTDRISTMESGIKDMMLHYLGLTELKAGNYKRAIELFDSALLFNPKDPDVYAHRGVAWERVGQPNKAELDYDQAFRLNPDHPLSMQKKSELMVSQGKFKEAEEELNEAIKNNPGIGAFYAQRGYLRFVRENFSGAIHDYDSAILLGTKDSELWVNRGLAFEKISKSNEAMENYRQALQTDPANPKAWFTQGNLFLKNGDLVKSIENFSMALSFDSAYAACYHNRAIAQQRLGKKKEACSDLKNSLKYGIKPDDQMVRSVCKD
ncbi:MAG: tetratricopeptide repeat protein [Bacteroidetes bacterium]|nr:tetratricopeptide repeat protein [Bacteroidota bacterium]